MFFSDIREDIVDRGIAKGEREMANLNERLNRKEAEDGAPEPDLRAGEHNSGQMAASDQIGTTPVATDQDKDSQRRSANEEDIRARKVDPEAVRESFKEAELDPVAENEPEEGEKAA